MHWFAFWILPHNVGISDWWTRLWMHKKKSRWHGMQPAGSVDSRFRLFMSRHWVLLVFFPSLRSFQFHLRSVQFNLVICCMYLMFHDFSTQLSWDDDKPLYIIRILSWSNQDFHGIFLFRATLTCASDASVQCISGNGFLSMQRTSPSSRWHWIAQQRFQFRKQESMGIAHSFLTNTMILRICVMRFFFKSVL